MKTPVRFLFIYALLNEHLMNYKNFLPLRPGIKFYIHSVERILHYVWSNIKNR